MPDDIDSAELRTIIAKVRLTTAEALELDRRIKAAGGGTRARYLREAALKNQCSEDLAELVGRIGLALNQLDHAPARRLGHIARQIDEIIFLMRPEDR
ncbi:hypothetical protein [Thioclava sp. SK-1]|uniref:plasmid mobilization protein n=1 Tax=Thioclava sp. SK-1 TaxID=1889770 RepID=UPI00159F345E|nr:hypothetical protein [Thioclava sp. SK-1]